MADNISEDFADNSYSYCSLDFQDFFYSANSILTTVNLIICCVGVVTNVLNVLVYTRRHMLKSTNIILTAIAISDLVVMATYIPQYIALHDSIRTDYPYYAAFVWIAHEYFLAVFHHISIWLTVALAIWRYVAVIHPLRSRTLCTTRRALIIIWAVVAFNLLITIPGYVDASIEEANETLSWKEGGCNAKYCAKWKPINCLRKIEFVYQGIVSKTVPCAILAFVSIRLIIALVHLNHQRQRLFGKSTRSKPSSTQEQTSSTAKHGKTSPKQSTKESKEFDNTTAMLVAVLVLFLITELPPSLAVVLEVFLDKVYYFECRRPVHYLILLMYYVSGCFNFFVYFSMSKNYRDTLLSLPVFFFLRRSNVELQKREDTSGSVESTVTIDTKL